MLDEIAVNTNQRAPSIGRQYIVIEFFLNIRQEDTIWKIER
jgi:hypothetical protein